MSEGQQNLFSYSCFYRPAERQVRAGIQLSLTVLNAMMELGACVSLLGECQGYDRVQSRHRPRWHTSPRSQPDVSDCKTCSLASMYHLVSIFRRVLEYAVCLFLIPLIFSSCTMASGELELRGKPAALSQFAIRSGHVVVASLFPCFG